MDAHSEPVVRGTTAPILRRDPSMGKGKASGRPELRPAACGIYGGLLADVREQAHEPGPLDRGAQRPLVSGAGARALAAKQFALSAAHFLQVGDVLVIDKGRPRAALLGAEPAAVAFVSSQLLANHSGLALDFGV